MRSARKAALVTAGVICLILAFFNHVFGEPIGQKTKSSSPNQAVENPKTNEEPKLQVPPEGRDLTTQELHIILDPIFSSSFDKKGRPDAIKESSAKQDNNDTNFVSRVIAGTRNLISRAFSYVGGRYKWGGTSRDGIDCSGLTRMLYLKEGIDLPHNAKMQFKLGKPVKKEDLLPGDLVFFNTRGPLTHVGIWIGNGQFIHAASRKRGVRIDYLSNPYYSKRFAGARRYKDFSKVADSRE
ncbi:MAG: C40 family peptidase [Armatimonadetes bacterium]|nr:C40 family peptidase [Armatimonadota bacterium]